MRSQMQLARRGEGRAAAKNVGATAVSVSSYTAQHTPSGEAERVTTPWAQRSQVHPLQRALDWQLSPQHSTTCCWPARGAATQLAWTT